MLYVTKHDSYIAKMHQIASRAFNKKFSGMTPPDHHFMLVAHETLVPPGTTTSRYALASRSRAIFSHCRIDREIINISHAHLANFSHFLRLSLGVLCRF